MTGKLMKMFFPAFFVLIPAGFSFGQNVNVIPVQPGLPGNTSTASAPANGIPSITDLMTVIDKAATNETKGKDWSTPVKLVIIFSGLAILPSLMVMMTSFTRIAIVLSFIRRALTTQSIPPTIAMMGLALFLTLYTMAPTFTKANTNAIQPYLANEIDFIPAFIISEFRTAFEIGCLLFIPFLLMDIVIASVLLSAGMMLLPPMMISLPLKLILFILVDGWGLLAESLSLSFR